MNEERYGMSNEIKRRVAMIEKKEKEKERLEYEIDLIKADCVKTYQLDRRYGEICDFVNLHDAWLKQPKKITNKKYNKKLNNKST